MRKKQLRKFTRRLVKATAAMDRLATALQQTAVPPLGGFISKPLGKLFGGGQHQDGTAPSRPIYCEG